MQPSSFLAAVGRQFDRIGAKMLLFKRSTLGRSARGLGAQSKILGFHSGIRNVYIFPREARSELAAAPGARNPYSPMLRFGSSTL
jgi:hypothetical protein